MRYVLRPGSWSAHPKAKYRAFQAVILPEGLWCAVRRLNRLRLFRYLYPEVQVPLQLLQLWHR